MTDNQNTRELVLNMLLEVLEQDKYSHTVLKYTLRKHQNMEKQERAFLSRLFIGTVKQYLTLDYVIQRYSDLPVKKMKPLIRNLLRLSVYQFMYMEQVPPSAVCNEAVKLAKKRGFVRLSGFVNGILRNISRNLSDISFPDRDKEPKAYLEVAYSVPGWLVDRLISQYPFDTVEKLLAASLKEKEVTVRCNLKKLSPQELKEKLQNEGVTVVPGEYLDYAFKIKNFDYLEKLASFCSGCFAVQDVSSMLVCEAAGIKDTDYVIDVCAAPGGKALHAAEKAKYVSARDITEYKTGLIEDNISRMGFTNVQTKEWDAAKADADSFEAADVVIADLPCSGLGVIGKKPDIKYKMTQNKHNELVTLQRDILNQVKNYVKKGGVLIYSTCTVDQEENIQNRNWFLEHSEFEAESLDPYLPKSLKSETTREGYLQLLQGVDNTDGFFLARFKRK